MSRGLGDVYKRQIIHYPYTSKSTLKSQYQNSLLSVLYLDILSF
ncbi:hypothetical protein JMUB7532_27650 [Staphylococcus aureus]